MEEVKETKDTREEEEKEIDIFDLQNEEREEPKEQFMTFRCASEVYGISIKYVNEIIGLQQITEIPESEEYIKGLINLRGKIIPVIDVRIRFGKEPLEYTDRTCVIVVSVQTTILGLIVDGIEGVVAFRQREITMPPSVSSYEEQAQKYVFGIGRIDGNVKLLISPEKLVAHIDMADASAEEEQGE